MSEPIRVLLHLDRIGPGGLEKKVLQLAARLDPTRFEVFVSHSSQLTNRKQAVRLRKITPLPPNHRFANRAVSQIRALAPAIFHSFSCSESADDVLAAHRAGIPVILTGRDNVRHWATGPVKDWECVRNALTARVTACCEAAAKLSRDVEGVKPEKIEVILNGVEPPQRTHTGPSLRQELGISADTVLAGYASRYEYSKGHDNLISAWFGVANQGRDVHLVCCGEFDQQRMKQVRESVAEHHLEGHITLLGPRSDMASFYLGLNLYVHPSHSEALSMSILEAMSYGLPVAAFAVGGTPEAVLNGETGFLAEAKNDLALRGAILRLAGDPQLRKTMGDAGRERALKCFSLERMVAAYQDLYQRAVDRFEAPLTPSPPRYTGMSGNRKLADTTVFITGKSSNSGSEQWMKHLLAQTVQCPIRFIEHIDSLPAILNRMSEICTTSYYVWVREDMLLAPPALEYLHDRLELLPADVALLAASLWDHELQAWVPCDAIYRHEVMKQFRYQDVPGCEERHLESLRAAGYRRDEVPSEKTPTLGEYGAPSTPEQLFQRWQWSFQRQNRHGQDSWLDVWPQRLLDRYLEDRTTMRLYALLGAISGIAAKAEGDREIDGRATDPALQRLRYYFPAG